MGPRTTGTYPLQCCRSQQAHGWRVGLRCTHGLIRALLYLPRFLRDHLALLIKEHKIIQDHVSGDGNVDPSKPHHLGLVLLHGLPSRVPAGQITHKVRPVQDVQDRGGWVKGTQGESKKSVDNRGVLSD